MSLKLIHPADVDYESLDFFKEIAAQAARQTANFIHPDWEVITWMYGQSAFAVKHKETSLVVACVIEGIGIKPLIALDKDLRAMAGQTFYDWIAKCNISASYNDLITSYATPLFFMPHAALAEGSHLGGKNAEDHIRGTFEAMQECSTAWGGGETSELQDIILPETICLSGCAVGFAMNEGDLINPNNLRAGQKILFLKSTGIHINGLSSARKVKEKLPEKYLTRIPGGRMFGEALLEPTRLYVRFMAECRKRAIHIAFAANISGHGITKVGRAPQKLTYRVKKLFNIPPVLQFLTQVTGKSIRDAYKAWNMGVGFMIIVEPQYVPACHEAAAASGDELIDAGEVEDGDRQVIVEPINEIYPEDELMKV